jgi:hypothetical protein
MEAVPKTVTTTSDKETGHVTRVTDTSFEPEVLAFCCEH